MTKTKLTFDEVVELIRGERTYQDIRWNPETTTSEGNHTWEEWIMYMEVYMGEAKRILATHARPGSDAIAGEIMRKVTTLGFAAMQNLGAPARQIPEPIKD